MARPLAYRRRRRHILRRPATRAHLPHRYQPRRASAAAVVAYRMHWMDLRIRSSRVGVPAVRHGRAREQGRDQGTAAAVSVSIFISCQIQDACY